MSTTAYMRIPSLRGYEDALRRFKETKPIRGSVPSVTPLGDRRDANRFAIRLAQNGDVQCLHHEQPLVVFHKPGLVLEGDDPAIERITVSFQRSWVHTADCYFIYELLHHYLSAVVRVHGKVIKMHRRCYEPPIVFPSSYGNEVRTMTLVANRRTGTIEPVQPVLVQGLRINRKAANIVRAKYGQFYRYFKGMIALRKESYPESLGQYVRFNDEEFVYASLGHKEHTSVFSHPHNPANKPAIGATVRHYCTTDANGKAMYEVIELHPKWAEAARAFIDKIATPDTDPDQTDKFAIAFTTVAASSVTRDSPYMNPVGNRRYSSAYVNVGVKELQTTLDEIVFKYHSDEVFETYIMPEGQAPSMKYDGWIDR